MIPRGGRAMRRTILGSVAIWVTGGAALAADGPTVSVVGLIPDGPPPAVVPVDLPVGPNRSAFLENRVPTLPAVQPLQQYTPPPFPAPPPTVTVAAPPMAPN